MMKATKQKRAKPTKTKMGRPPIDPEDRRDVPIKVLVTAAEQESMASVAKGQDLSVSSWLRRLGLDAVEKAK